MAVTIKSEREIQLMREAGKILAKVHEELAQEVKAGMTSYQIDKICEEIIRGYGCIPSFLGYEGYPGSVCISINDEVVHGLPSKDKIVRDGDIVSLDTGVIYKGYQSDAARTIAIGEISKEAQQLIDVTKQSFFEGIKFAKDPVEILAAYRCRYIAGHKGTGGPECVQRNTGGTEADDNSCV